jgi:hypothetical protein
MSSIDDIPYKCVGYFCGIPIYHPLADGTIDDIVFKIPCTTKQLLVGGGAGEHPIVQVLRPDYAVGHFVDAWHTVLSKSHPPHEPLDVFLEKRGASTKAWKQFLKWSTQTHPSEFLKFHFVVKDYVYFYEWCKARATRFAEKEPFEYWMAASLGEFILFSMPELFPDLEKQLPGARLGIYDSYYNNLRVSPKGYPPHAETNDSGG